MRISQTTPLAQSAVWSLLGQLVPFAVAAIAIPTFLHVLGVARFGLLTIAWVFVGYFTLFDLGLGRAVTKFAAERNQLSQAEEVSALTWTGQAVTLMLGVLGGLILFASATFAIQSLAHTRAEDQRDAVRSLQILSLAMPSVTMTTGLRGVLEAQNRFDLSSAGRVFLSIAIFVLPIPLLFSFGSLSAVAVGMVAGRWLNWGVHAGMCLRTTSGLWTPRFDLSLIGPLAQFGGWTTIYSVVGPVLVYLDRFVIGAALSSAAVAYYATPYEVATKAWLIPMALVGVLFPAFARALIDDQRRAVQLFAKSVSYLFMAMTPIAALMVAGAPELLGLWIGRDFSSHSAIVLQILAVAVYVNSMGFIPSTLLPAAGRPDLVAKVQLLEIAPYVATVLFLVHADGIEGAALSWGLRVAADSVVLYFVAAKLLHIPFASIRVQAVLTLIATLCLIALPMLATSLWARLALSGIITVAALGTGWCWLLPGSDRRRLITAARRPSLLLWR